MNLLDCCHSFFFTGPTCDEMKQKQILTLRRASKSAIAPSKGIHYGRAAFE